MLPRHELAGCPGRATGEPGLPSRIRGEVWAQGVQDQPDDPALCRRDLP